MEIKNGTQHANYLGCNRAKHYKSGIKTTVMNTQLKQRVVFALLMGVVTTGIISFTLIGINMGFIEGFLKIWIRSWATAYAVVIPAIVFVGPRVQAIVNRIIK